MAVTLKIRQALIVDGLVVEGDLEADVTITLTSGGYFRAHKLLADNFTADIFWTKGEGGMDTFTHGFVFSNQDVVVELRTDKGTAEFVLLFIRANELTPLAVKVGGNTTESLDGLILVDGTDFDDVDRIEIQRDVADAVGDATVSLYLFN